jgi:hypothetical protein
MATNLNTSELFGEKALPSADLGLTFTSDDIFGTKIPQLRSAFGRNIPQLRAAKLEEVGPEAVVTPDVSGTTWTKTKGKWEKKEPWTARGAFRNFLRNSDYETFVRLSKVSGTPGLTTEEYEKQMRQKPLLEQAEPLISAGMALSAANAPIQTLKGLAYFLGTKEAASRTVLPLAKEFKQIIEGKQATYEYTELKDLLPKGMRDIADIGEFVLYGAGAHAFSKYVKTPRVQAELAGARYRFLKAMGVKQETGILDLRTLTDEQLRETLGDNAVKHSETIFQEEIAKRGLGKQYQKELEATFQRNEALRAQVRAGMAEQPAAAPAAPPAPPVAPKKPIVEVPGIVKGAIKSEDLGIPGITGEGIDWLSSPKEVVVNAITKGITCYRGTSTGEKPSNVLKLGGVAGLPMTDPGYFGQGIYYTTSEWEAGQYGKTESTTIKLNNPLVLSGAESRELIEQYGTAKDYHTKEGFLAALEQSKKLTSDLISQGYDGIVIQKQALNNESALEIVVFDQKYAPTEGKEKPTKPPEEVPGIKVKAPRYITVILDEESKVILEKIKAAIQGATPGRKWVTRDAEGNVVAAGYEDSTYSYVPYWPKGLGADTFIAAMDNYLKGKVTAKQKDLIETLIEAHKEVENEGAKLKEAGISQAGLDEIYKTTAEKTPGFEEPSGTSPLEFYDQRIGEATSEEELLKYQQELTDLLDENNQGQISQLFQAIDDRRKQLLDLRRPEMQAPEKKDLFQTTGELFEGTQKTGDIFEAGALPLEQVRGMTTNDLEKHIDARYAAGAPQDELDALETIYDTRVTEEEVGVGEATHQGADLEEQLIHMYHRYITPSMRSGMEEADILGNMRSAIQTYGGTPGTDAQILSAAKELYEARKALISRYKAKKARSERAATLREVLEVLKPIQQELYASLNVTPADMENVISKIEKGEILPPDLNKMVEDLTNQSIEALKAEMRKYEDDIKRKLEEGISADKADVQGSKAAGTVDHGKQAGKAGKPVRKAGTVPVSELIAQGRLSNVKIEGAIRQSLAAKREWLHTVLSKNFYLSMEDVKQLVWTKLFEIAGWNPRKQELDIWIVKACDFILRNILAEYATPDQSRYTNEYIVKYRSALKEMLEKGDVTPSIENIAKKLKISVKRARYIKFMADNSEESLEGMEEERRERGGAAAFAMPPGGLEAWVEKIKERRLELKPLGMPELVKLAVMLSGDYPVIKKLLKSLGAFHFGKEGTDVKWITLNAKIFKDPVIASMVLAHEIGHMIDWLPDYFIARGNILGRLATLRDYRKSLLAEKPGMEWTVLDEEDRKRLRAEAEKQLRAEAKMTEREIIEEIIKEIPIYEKTTITADLILSLWKEAATSMRTTHPELYKFIAELSGAQKNAVIKQALMGIVDERIVKMYGGKRVGTKIVKEFKKRTITPEPLTPQNISRRFKQLLKEEILKRKLFSEEVIRDELKRVTQWWNPFDDTRSAWYTSYRYSGEELYAEALSVLLNAPNKLEELAPNFYKAFWNYIDEKPEVKKALLELNGYLNMGEAEVLKIRQEDIRGMFKKGEEGYFEKRKEYELSQRSLWFKLRTELIDKNTAVLDAVKAAEKAGHIINPEDNPKFYLEEFNYIGGKLRNRMDEVDTKVRMLLQAMGMDDEVMGEYLFLRRVVSERKDIANPLGQDRGTAQRQLDYLKLQLGDDKFTALEKARVELRAILEKMLIEAAGLQMYKPAVALQLITNEDYAPFQVLEHLDDWVTASVISQKGTLKPISNPFASYILKMLSLKRAIERIKTNNSVINFMLKENPDEIERAPTRRFGKYGANIPEKEGYGIIKTRIGGNLVGYYVDPYIAQSVNSSPRNINNAVIGVLRFFNSGWFRPVYVNLNLGFQSFNLIRDFLRSWKLNPDVNFFTHIGYYFKALPIAKRRVWGNFTDPVIKQMQETGMLSFTYNDIIRGAQDSTETEIEFLMRIHDANKKGKSNPFTWWLKLIEDTGNLIETIPHVSRYLTELKEPKKNIREIAHRVRIYSGSPDFLRKGAGYEWYNNLFLFSNAIKEGIRGDLEGAFKDPKTRTGYWWRTCKVNILPKVLLFLATLGFFGVKMKEAVDSATEYDKTNYLILPLGMDEEGNVTYLRLPQDEMGRLMGALFWKGMNVIKDKELNNVSDVFSVLGGQAPSITPAVELVVTWGSYLTGQNPYDWMRGRQILTDDEKLVGGWFSLKPMIGWTAGKLGLYGATLRTRYADQETTKEKILRFTPILQRFLRVTRYGQDEILRQQKEGMQWYKARQRLKKKYIY